MLNTENITFRCITAKNKTLFTPKYMHDVADMRRHPEYEELDAAGNVVPRKEQEIQIKRVPVQAPAPVRKGKK